MKLLHSKIKFNCFYFLFFVLVFNTNLFAQTTVLTEDFSTTTNITPSVGSLGSGTSSGTCGNNDIFGISANHGTPANITGCISGNTGSMFGAMDIDACGGNTSTVKSITLLTYTVPNNNALTFSGDFAVLGASNNSAGYTAVVTLSTDNGVSFPTTLFTFTGNGNSTYSCSCGGNITSTFSTKTTSIGSNLSGQVVKIKVTFTGMSVNDRGIALDQFKILETVPACSAPTTQATSLSFSNVGASSTDLTWTNGNGDKVLVVARATSSILTDPTDGITYTANTTFGSGTQIGTGNYVVYNGTGTSVSVIGLSNSTSYTYSVYAFNSVGNCYNATELTAAQSTTACSNPTTAPTSLVFSSVVANSLNLSWTNGNGDKVLVVAKLASSTTTDPSNGTTYTANTIFGSGTQIGTGNYVVYNGTGTTVSVTGLSAYTNYTFSVYAYNAASCYNTSELSSSQMTTHNVFYINNGTIDGNDVYTTAVGNNTNDGKSPSTPKLTFGNLWSSYSGVIADGDIIYVDAGNFQSSTASAPNCECGFTINKAISIIGVSNTKTTFDNNNVGTTGSYYFANLNASVSISGIQFINYSNFASGNGQVFNISGTSSPGVTLTNVITNDNGGTGGNAAIKITGNSNVTIDGGGQLCDGATYSYAGGIDVVGSGSTINLTVTDHVFAGNSRNNDNGAALNISGSGTINVSVSNTIFSGNSITSDSYSGASIFASSGTLSLTDCIIESSNTYNNSVKYGAACHFTGGTQNFTRVLVRNNANGLSSGGTSTYGTIAVRGGALTLTDSYFSGNSSKQGNDIYSGSGSITATNTTFGSTATGFNVYRVGGSITLTNSGNPSNTGSPSFNNTTSPSAFTAPSTPSYTGVCNTIILPIELLDFDAFKVDYFAKITWSTASETNNNFFTIEKSYDGRNWFELTQVSSVGNTTRQTYYQFDDKTFMEEINYYRLSQTDYDGKSKTYSTKSVLFEKDKVEYIYRNVLGQEIDFENTPSGVYLKCFSDGTSIKVFKN